MNIHCFLFPIFLVLTSMWLGWSLLVDFFIVPTVFATIDSFFQAGDLGIAVFSKLNKLEVIVSTVLVSLFSFHFVKTKKGLPLLVMVIFAWVIALSYFSFLTPKLVTLTELWKKTDLMGLTGVAEITDVQQEHQFYHNLYIGIDTLKIFLLSGLLVFGSLKQDQFK
ncbi:MAG: hypothetical protein ACLGHN_08655 [Bacteriovoracia bacterium]